jgi:hypothetical protein
VPVRPRKIVILQGEYTPEEIAKFLLYATGRSDDPDAKPGSRTVDPRQIPKLKPNLQLAIKTIRTVYDTGLFENKSSPGRDLAIYLAAYHVQKSLGGRDKCPDYTAIKKALGGESGHTRTLWNKLKARGQTLEMIAAAITEKLS